MIDKLLKVAPSVLAIAFLALVLFAGVWWVAALGAWGMATLVIGDFRHLRADKQPASSPATN